MKILHMSDLHITEFGHEIWETDTLAHFDQAIKTIHKMNDIDAIIVTGDLSNDGSLWSYNYIDNAFTTLGIPVFCCPGNHDNISNMSSMKYCRLDKTGHINGYRILNIDSTIPDMGRGNISNETMSFIDQQILDSEMPVIIAFHHPSIEPGGWLNRKLLENREAFNEYITTRKNVKLVLYGHIHYSTKNRINNTIFSSAPSLGFAFDKDLPTFQIACGQEGFDVIEIINEEINMQTVLI